MNEATLIKSHGDHRNLICYRKAELIYDITYHFAYLAFERGNRTIDQMVQAARSGKQNIIEGIPYIDKGAVVSLQKHIPSLTDEVSGTSGWRFGFGSTGFYPMGNGLYYISHNYANKDGQGSNLHLYRLTDNKEEIFVRVE